MIAKIKKKYDRDLMEGLYDFHKYLDNLSIEDAKRRYADIIRFWITMPRRVPDPIETDNILSPWYWRQKIAHLELRLRRLNFQKSPSFEHLRPLYDHFDYQRPTVPFGSGGFCRIGKFEHLKLLRHDGVLYLNNASYYKEIEGDLARYDDELKLSVNYADSTRIKVYKQDGTFLGGVQNFKRSWESTTDKYIFCFSTELDPGCFEAFQSPYALIVNNVGELRRRIQLATSEYLSDFIFSDYLQVPYHDFACPGGHMRSIIPSLSKDISYAYQKEARFIWSPKKPLQSLGPFKLNIGSIADISEIIEVPEKIWQPLADRGRFGEPEWV